MSAIRNAIENKVQGAISSNLRKVAGGILRGNRSNTQIPPSARNNLDQGRYNVKSLSYPLNVDTDNRQGHYILFEINELKKSKLTIDQALTNPLATEFDDTQIFDYRSAGTIGQANEKEGMSKNTNSVYKEMYQSSKRLDTTISLYMPPTVQVNYGANYGANYGNNNANNTENNNESNPTNYHPGGAGGSGGASSEAYNAGGGTVLFVTGTKPLPGSLTLSAAAGTGGAGTSGSGTVVTVFNIDADDTDPGA